MNKKYAFWSILGMIIIAGIIAFLYITNKNNSTELEGTNYNSTRTIQNTADNTSDTETSNNNEISSDNESDQNQISNSKSSQETEVGSFTTKIYTKDSDRQNNITLACSALNDTTVENGQTFSFSNTVGKATSAKGYKKADVFRNGDVIEALGGGLCQVSTTLYNAVLKVSDTKVTERHSHSNKVPYIKSGKDAAVSYGTYDFKFVNNTGNTLKIKASNTPDNVTIKIMKLE